MSQHTASGDWAFPVPTTYGAGRIAELPALMKAKGIQRPLVVTDKGGDRHGVAALLRSAALEPALFDEVEPNPTDQCVRRGAEAFHRHAADAVVAIGGGSGLDGGKSIAMVAGSGRPLSEFEWTLPPVALGAKTLPPTFLVPTTAGTGAEMDSASMVTDTTARIKICVAHPELRCHVVADPALTLTLPANLTAWTGMDALTHALEALWVDAYHPMCDGIALEALRLIHDWLPTAVRQGGNVEARSRMLAASSMAAVAFQKGLGATHGLSEPIGAVHNTQHGLTNAVVLPIVLRANRGVVAQKMEQVARYLALPLPPSSYCEDEAERRSGFVRVAHWIDRLSTDFAIPSSLKELGLDETSTRDLGVKAEANPTGWTNPIRFTAAEYERIYAKALAGHDRSRFYNWSVRPEPANARAALGSGAATSQVAVQAMRSKL